MAVVGVVGGWLDGGVLVVLGIMGYLGGLLGMVLDGWMGLVEIMGDFLEGFLESVFIFYQS